MSTQFSQPLNQKRLIQEFLLKGRSRDNDLKMSNKNEIQIDTNKSQIYFPQIEPNQCQPKQINHSSSQNLSNINIDIQNKLNNYFVAGDLQNEQSRRFIKLKNNKSESSQYNNSFSPFLKERDSLGNLLKDQQLGTKKSERYIQYKLKQYQSGMQLSKGRIPNKNQILPYSGYLNESSVTELESLNAHNRKYSEQNSESFKDKYTQFVVRLNILDNPSQTISDVLKTEDTNHNADRSLNQDCSSIQFQNFTLMNRLKQYTIKQKTPQNKDMFTVNTSLLNQNSSLNKLDNQSKKYHLNIKKIHQIQQSNPPVGSYNPNYSLIQKNQLSHRIQPIFPTSRSQQKQLEYEQQYQQKSPSQKQDQKKKQINSDNEENYEKLFNKMMREIKKQVDLEQQQNQGNLLHPDGDKELKKVMSSEEMENFSNQYKKQMGDMKNIFNRIRSSLNQNKLNNLAS
ncbi:hypothetical protein TTHERM_00784560 (macronuclear) [Tetrahymena thermophila SB210]|uniref:Uncharacterized protein n=1 Tax=Tetrahymena thermophila (strain SB210) TaxID=312017 RepID=Q231N3_TETTS|nr:hypothetical protein TTHERM_00784560 [Tetrahymena thermophila SB210]EAR91269.1 hypothetical protein TTHERM_00784560 [Tetrahymena thermophila SB210]|eukprot:XP_001011514.1 hypothetical protein TTHERM_00784560 [Tetrahymena thermophila SB210]